MKHILVVSGSLRIGGLEKVAVDCMKYADRTVCAFDFLVFDNEIHGYETVVQDMGGRIIRIPHSHNPLSHILHVMRVMKKYGRYDIIHSHVFFHSGIIMLAAFLQRIPVRIAHAHSIQRKGINWRKRFFFCILRILLQLFTTIPCACSLKAGQYLFGNRIFSQRGIIIPNIVDIDAFKYNVSARNRIRKKYGIGDKDIVIGQVGHLTPAKNQKFLLRTFRQYLLNNCSAKLLIVGDGELASELGSLALQLGITENLYFTGNKENVGDYLSAMDVFVCTSTNEGLGIALLEAQANGLHCVAEKHAIVDEVRDLGNCLFVDGFENYDAWVDNIQRAINMRNDKKAIQKLVISSFSNNGLIKAIKKIYGY